MTLNKVTEVKITRIPQQAGLIAIARIVINSSLVLEGIGVHEKRDGTGYRLTYPTRKDSCGQARTLFHPIHADLSYQIEQTIFDALNALDHLKDVAHDRYHHSVPR